MRTNLIGLLAGILAFAVITSVPVFAAVPASGTVGTPDDLGNYTQSAPDSANVMSGHVYYSNISGTQSTYFWTGLLGNVSGDIVLADASNNNFYQWAGADGLLVYASNESSLDWDNIAAEDGTNVPAWLKGEFKDNYTNTIAGTRSFPSQMFQGITTDYLTTLSSGATNWYEYVVNDGSGKVAWVAEVVAGGTAYNSDTVDYQLMIPEDGDNNDQTTTTYYLWLELE